MCARGTSIRLLSDQNLSMPSTSKTAFAPLIDTLTKWSSVLCEAEENTTIRNQREQSLFPNSDLPSGGAAVSPFDFDDQILNIVWANPGYTGHLSEGPRAERTELMARLECEGRHVGVVQIFRQRELAHALEFVCLGPFTLEVASILDLKLCRYQRVRVEVLAHTNCGEQGGERDILSLGHLGHFYRVSQTLTIALGKQSCRLLGRILVRSASERISLSAAKRCSTTSFSRSL